MIKYITLSKRLMKRIISIVHVHTRSTQIIILKGPVFENY